MNYAKRQGGTESDVYNTIKWHVRARRRRELTLYFYENYAKPEGAYESEPEVESGESREQSFEEGVSFEVQKKPLVQRVKSEPQIQYPNPIIRPSTPQRIMSEKQIKELLARVASLEDRAKGAEHENMQLKEQIQNILEERTEESEVASTIPTEKSVVRAKTYIPKLVPYTSEKDDIRLWVKRFESYAENLNLTREQQVSEFIAHGRGPIENIVLTKDLDAWTIEMLKNTVLLRLAPNWDMNRIEQELYKVKVDFQDDPDAVMNKIVKVLVKRDEDVEMNRLRQTQFNHFIRLIHMHEPMHTYVLNECKEHTDPDLALAAAKQYLKEKGNDVTYFRSLVQQSLRDAGVATKEVDHSIFPLLEKPSTTPSAPQTTASATAKTATVAESSTTPAASANAVTPEFVEQFVKKTDKLSQEAMNRRFNDLERLMRDLRVAGLPDFLKNKDSKEKFSKEKNTKTESSTRSSDSEKPKRRFEKNSKGKDKKYKKNFVEKESGEILAQYITDDSGDEEGKDE